MAEEFTFPLADGPLHLMLLPVMRQHHISMFMTQRLTADHHVMALFAILYACRVVTVTT